MPGSSAADTVHLQLAKLPSPDALYRTVVALHILDTLRAPRFRTFRLVDEGGARRFVLDRGSGDLLVVAFTRDGHVIRGFDHESPISPYQVGTLWSGLYDGLPSPLRAHVAKSDSDDDTFPEVAGDDDAYAPATFCTWWSPDENRWLAGRIAPPTFGPYDSDGASMLLGLLTPDIVFLEQAGWPDALVERIMRHEAVDDATLRTLAPEANLDAVRGEMASFGYGNQFPFS